MKERFDLKGKKKGGQRPPRLIEGGKALEAMANDKAAEPVNIGFDLIVSS